jgi:hypothetical protein
MLYTLTEFQVLQAAEGDHKESDRKSIRNGNG